MNIFVTVSTCFKINEDIFAYLKYKKFVVQMYNVWVVLCLVILKATRARNINDYDYSYSLNYASSFRQCTI